MFTYCSNCALRTCQCTAFSKRNLDRQQTHGDVNQSACAIADAGQGFHKRTIRHFLGLTFTAFLEISDGTPLTLNCTHDILSLSFICQIGRCILSLPRCQNSMDDSMLINSYYRIGSYACCSKRPLHKRVIYSYYSKPSPTASICGGGFLSASWGRDGGCVCFLWILNCHAT